MSNSSIRSQPKGAGYSIDFSREGEAPTYTLIRPALPGFDDTKASEATVREITNAISTNLNAGLEPVIAITEACKDRATPESFCNGTINLTVWPPGTRRSMVTSGRIAGG